MLTNIIGKEFYFTEVELVVLGVTLGHKYLASLEGNSPAFVSQSFLLTSWSHFINNGHRIGAFHFILYFKVLRYSIEPQLRQTLIVEVRVVMDSQ